MVPNSSSRMVTVHSAITPRGISDLGGFEDSSASAVKVVFSFTTFYCSELQPLAVCHEVSWILPQRFPASFERRTCHLRQSATADADTPRVHRAGFFLHTAGRGGPGPDEDRRAQPARGRPVRHCPRPAGPTDELRSPGGIVPVRPV